MSRRTTSVWRIESGDVIALVGPETELSTQTAEKQFNAVAKDLLVPRRDCSTR